MSSIEKVYMCYHHELHHRPLRLVFSHRRRRSLVLPRHVHQRHLRTPLRSRHFRRPVDACERPF